MIYHPDPTSFIEKSGEYGALGKTLVSLSNLEFAHDQFVLKVVETNSDLAIKLSRSFPRQFRQKTDFLINSVACIGALRAIPIFANGELDLLWLQYQLDELYEIRSIIAHGSIFFSVANDDRITWTFERFVKSGKNAWRPEGVKMSNGYLASVHHSASLVKNYMIRLTRCLDGSSIWEEEYQADKEIRENRNSFAELMAFGMIVDDKGLLAAFPPLGPVE